MSHEGITSPLRRDEGWLGEWAPEPSEACYLPIPEPWSPEAQGWQEQAPWGTVEAYKEYE